MPLNDREQSILDEIERQFYEEDPDLVAAVQRIQFGGSKRSIRLSIVGLILGVAILLVTFSISAWLALVGFLLMVVSATRLVQSYRIRAAASSPDESAARMSWPRWPSFRRFRFRR